MLSRLASGYVSVPLKSVRAVSGVVRFHPNHLTTRYEVVPELISFPWFIK